MTSRLNERTDQSEPSSSPVIRHPCASSHRGHGSRFAEDPVVDDCISGGSSTLGRPLLAFIYRNLVQSLVCRLALRAHPTQIYNTGLKPRFRIERSHQLRYSRNNAKKKQEAGF